jgi:hypothetical protein
MLSCASSPRSAPLPRLCPLASPTTNDYLFTATATPSRNGMIVVKKSGDL